MCASTTFSILYRIEPTVTEQGAGGGHSCASFQYPLSDRTHCNGEVRGTSDRYPLAFSILYRIEPTVTMMRIAPAFTVRNFQYPLSDRTHCNASRPAPIRCSPETFSILYRIEPTVTAKWMHRQGDVDGSFSILYRIEPTVTPAAVPTLPRELLLSVSSIGSNPL